MTNEQKAVEMIMKAIRESSQNKTTLLKTLQKANNRLTIEKQLKKGVA